MSIDEQALRAGLRAWEASLRETFERRIPRQIHAPVGPIPDAERDMALEVKQAIVRLRIEVETISSMLAGLPLYERHVLAAGLGLAARRLGEVAKVCEGRS